MGNRVKKAVVASSFGLGVLLAAAGPAVAQPFGVSWSDCVWGGGQVIQLQAGGEACLGGSFDGKVVVG
ncbi:hypothetical protein [Saccharopolyspora oryzae]|uniref:Uncharacterized protein n=1 Tax=Saccharopolyspora oryzae TaxID=2997343 RepID=A0ABT4V328_9PSEU|nr:hypothetical protein [Saccharopolyspora oryzae]MDA3627804.1 hypothetical protein [Saccharopolyspora oryzae]